MINTKKGGLQDELITPKITHFKDEVAARSKLLSQKTSYEL